MAGGEETEAGSKEKAALKVEATAAVSPAAVVLVAAREAQREAVHTEAEPMVGALEAVMAVMVVFVVAASEATVSNRRSPHTR